MSLNLSNRQIAHELGLNEDDAQKMTQQLRQGIVDAAPTSTLTGVVEIDEAYVVAGHKGQSAEVKKNEDRADGDVYAAKGGVVRHKRRSRRSWV